ncbi:helix-hairpin-helix domain-containing protein [Roseateles sp. DAIF2]|uniref:ComEA family DNA-binding protein n=1 Tax=Roseateles sp. DAIF2 TaxID=2714952 RepID=UPI0018A33294|nr:helix-hairpin-helix domain-containing protein [Roseateles sp. DAIF2]QPF73659.1 helix-hairpin-helix domain-containing protein [Roseateles sp. DAIF2]
MALLAPGWLWAQPHLLELNQADRAELESLPGIGPQLAERLLAARAQGPFADWAELRRRVRGIGPALARRLSDAGLRVRGRALEEAPPAATASASSG